MIVGQLDLRSLTRLQRVSFQGDAYVRACLEYRDLLTHVPGVLETFGDLGLSSTHRIADIHRVFRTDACATCGDRGPLLFLPTCERCCEACVAYYPALRLIRPSEARRYYGLSKQQCEELHALHLPPRMVGAVGEATRLRPHTLYPKAVSAKAARDLALTVYGSEEALAQAVNHAGKGMIAPQRAKYWHEAHRASPRHNWLRRSLRDEADDTPKPPESLDSRKLAEASTMLFPTLTKRPTATLGTAMWCRGCDLTQYILAHWVDEMDQVEGEWKALVPPEYQTEKYWLPGVVLGMAKRAWSRDSFLEHVRHCPGAQRLRLYQSLYKA
ncbi:F-box domain-containing protein [Apiospora marii]|uniref:F-box domain-containing protein n=1 Tax=Apiospora marii TaxID=335849 RepID=UPI00312FBF13